MITVLADKYLRNLENFLPENVNLLRYDPDKGLPCKLLSEADALLIRTVTRINAETLPEIPDSLSFIGTGSAGTDHVDIPWLKAKGIHFASAAGCNARSVAEYVASGLLMWAEHRGLALSSTKVGIVGMGNVGSELDRLLRNLKITTVKYDPPRQRREPSFHSSSLEELLDCPVLTFHVPLNERGEFATYYWLDHAKLKNRRFELVINTSRGGVVCEADLMKALSDGTVKDVIVDVWENEPGFDPELARRAFKATPHIAGYSRQAKLKASQIVVEKMLGHFGVSGPSVPINDRPPQKITLTARGTETVTGLLDCIHPLNRYDQQLRDIVSAPQPAREQKFKRIRTNFPLRNEFGYLSIKDAIPARYIPLLRQLGLDHLP